MTSACDNVVTGKLRLKGRGRRQEEEEAHQKLPLRSINSSFNRMTGGSALGRFEDEDCDEEERKKGGVMGCLTAAERRYMEQVERIEAKRMAAKSHHDRVQEFNQYLANLSEHYDIPKVGPG